MTLGRQVLDELQRFGSLPKSFPSSLSCRCRQRLSAANSVEEVIAGLKSCGIEGVSASSNPHELARQVASTLIRTNAIAWSDQVTVLGGLLLVGAGIGLTGSTPALGIVVAVMGGLVAARYGFKLLSRRGDFRI